jgi:hypothetical protein
LILYSLSTRQRLQLRDGVGLSIALPISPDVLALPPDQLTPWAADRLPDVPPAWIRSAKRQSVWTHATNRGGGDSSPASMWGEVVDSGRADAAPVLSIACVIVSVSQVSAPVSTRPARWPGGKFRIPEKI